MTASVSGRGTFWLVASESVFVPQKWSATVTKRTFLDPELEATAISALEEARSLPPGLEQTEALRRAGHLRNAADSYQRVFSSEIRNADQS